VVVGVPCINAVLRYSKTGGTQGKSRRPEYQAERRFSVPAGALILLKFLANMAKKKFKKSDIGLFIDANAYLQFFKSTKAKDLIESLQAQQDHIFITKQIVDEVQRNKVEATHEQFKEHEKEENAERQGQFVPVHLMDEKSRKERNKEHEAAQAFYKKLAEERIRILKQVSRSEDPMSQALSPIFKKTVSHSDDELIAAQRRKLFGNPPGKHDDPIGDELTWEQLLNHTKGKVALWIITDDRDYITKHGKEIFFNAFLRSELPHSMEVFCFDNIASGIADFADATGEGKKDLPSPHMLEAIRTEIEESPGEAVRALLRSLAATSEPEILETKQLFDFLLARRKEAQKRDLVERAKRALENSRRKSPDGEGSDEGKK
jgi:hypothetical protein